MDGSHAERRPALTPVRLLVGSLIGGAGIVALAFFFGGSPASAAEPAPSAPGGHSLLSTAGSLASSADGSANRVVAATGGTLAAAAEPVAKAVARAVPAPVQQAAAPVAEPLTAAVHEIVASTPVSQAVAVVTAPVDSLGRGVPLAGELLGDTPFGTVATPIAGVVDHVVGSVVTVTTAGVDPVLGPSTPAGVALIMPPVLAALGAVTPDARATTPDATATSPNAAATGARILAHDTPAAAVPARAPSSPGDPDGSPFAQPEGTATGSSASGSPGGPATAIAAADFALVDAIARENSAATDDRLPSSPVADHDSSPD